MGTSGIPSVKLEGCSRDVLMAFDLYRVVAEDGWMRLYGVNTT